MIAITNKTEEEGHEQFIQEILQEVLEGEGKEAADISVALVGPVEAQRLNIQHRKHDYVPNVLSFEQIGEGLGELVLCPEQIRKEAEEYGVSYHEELARMLVHGALHLLGFSHENMEQKEKKYRALFDSH